MYTSIYLYLLVCLIVYPSTSLASGPPPAARRSPPARPRGAPAGRRGNANRKAECVRRSWTPGNCMMICMTFGTRMLPRSSTSSAAELATTSEDMTNLFLGFFSSSSSFSFSHFHFSSYFEISSSSAPFPRHHHHRHYRLLIPLYRLPSSFSSHSPPSLSVSLFLFVLSFLYFSL